MSDHLAAILADALQNLATEWRTKATARRAVSKPDPVADALDFCAEQALACIRNVQVTSRQLTVDQYARLAHVDVTPQTVRNWIRGGRLAATDTVKGYRIAAHAKVSPAR
jgi:hypothetical protein